MEDNTIQKESVLGGPMEVLPARDGGDGVFEHREYDAKAQMDALGVPLVERVEVVNQLTGERTTVTIRHDGTTDSKVALTLADPNATREQKDSVVSMYLFESGKHNASFLMDLWSSKGQHTKESRHWMSQMRFDFELFLETFRHFMHESADRVIKGMGAGVEVVKDRHGNESSVIRPNPGVTLEDLSYALGDMALFMKDTAELLKKRIDGEKHKRELEKGKGIYVGLDNKPYSIYDDEEVAEVVSKDQAEAKKEKHDRG